ncbi:DNA helicase RecQ [Paraferrimonas sp. SM1919]|uniref:DNA helicase RecQ n=1 Tax=Paraferrimonas sp. SM1919 TaxID=2662263 RepID=UPI0013D8BA68|nr:DNA helicase RecQ [Paraferrimonas sp. SM1919]
MSHVLEVLKKVYGYDQFRGQQQAIIEAVIAGEDTVTIMPTGGGKSLCYQLPALIRNGLGVVVSPLIALMQDQVDTLHQLGINAVFLNSTQSYREQQEIEHNLKSGHIKLLYIAPERLLMPQTIILLKSIEVALFAIDEAHCISQWGHDFRPVYQQLSILKDHFNNVPLLALTATADQQTKFEIKQKLKIPNAIEFLHSFDRSNIRYHIVESATKEALWGFIQSNHPTDAGVVYCLSKKSVEETALWLEQKGRTALAYHGGLNKDIRAKNQQRFLREDGIIIVATIAFGMGIDKPDVRFVAHMNLPKSIEAYYQETGRAGRDGQPANAWMSYKLQDLVQHKHMLEDSEGSSDFKQIGNQKLNALIDLCESSDCRRISLLSYFDEKLDQPCGNCDNCLNPPEQFDGTIPAQMAISVAYRTQQRFGTAYLIDILVGNMNERIKQNDHHMLPTHGVGKEITKKQWRSIFRQLIAKGLLELQGEYKTLRLTPACREVLQGKRQLQLNKVGKTPVKTPINEASSTKTPDAEKLFEELKKCRAQIAKDGEVPAYIICHNSTLTEIAEVKPTSLEKLYNIRGLGQSRIEKYGQELINVVLKFREDQTKEKNTLKQTNLETLELLKKGLAVENIAKERKLSLSTIQEHCALLIWHRLLNLQSVYDINNDEITEINQHLVAANFSTELRLKPVFEALNERYSYPILKCVAAHLYPCAQSQSE